MEITCDTQIKTEMTKNLEALKLRKELLNPELWRR